MSGKEDDGGGGGGKEDSEDEDAEPRRETPLLLTRLGTRSAVPSRGAA